MPVISAVRAMQVSIVATVTATPRDSGADQRPAVLFLHASDELYGSDRMLLTVLDAVRERVRPIVVLPADTVPGGLSPELLARGLDVRRCQIPVVRRRYMSPFGLVRLWLTAILGLVQLARLGRASGVVAVHTNTSAVLVGPLVAALLRVTHIWHIHEIVDHPRWLGRAIGVATRSGRQRVVAISEAVARQLRLDGGRVSDVLLNPAPDVDDPGPPSSDALPVVLMAGRVNGRKGHDVFVRAASLLRDSGTQAVFEIVGGAVPGQTEPFDRLVAAVRELDPTSTWLRFDGWADDMDDRIVRATMVVLPTTNQEPLNITALEAMARRRPVVASNTGGLVEVVDDGVTGLLVPPADEIALAKAIGSLLADRELADRMGQAGRQRAISAFSRRAYANAWERLYDETAKR
jgi:glycosyltransferase involved in cell wall biosynthesis